MIKRRLIIYSLLLIGIIILYPKLLKNVQSAEKGNSAQTSITHTEVKTVTTTPVEIKAQHIDKLSHHITVAEFEGIKDHTCMGLTALCPDKCGHSGKLAQFKIKRYLQYKKTGEYGDPQQERFDILIESKGENPSTIPLISELKQTIESLNPGESVLLAWDHLYITDAQGSKFPERPVTIIQKLTPEEEANIKITEDSTTTTSESKVEEMENK